MKMPDETIMIPKSSSGTLTDLGSAALTRAWAEGEGAGSAAGRGREEAAKVAGKAFWLVEDGEP